MSIADPIVNILQWLSDTNVAEAIRDSVWIFPAIETVHVIAIALVVGSIMRVDLRLAGLVWRDRPVTEVSDQMLPWTWASFVVATIFGLLLFAAKPFTYLQIVFFDVKMFLIGLAGLNMVIFQHVIFKGVAKWDRSPMPPTAVRLAGSLSLAFWVSVLVCGRLIGFV
jgi:hypothetical protein